MKRETQEAIRDALAWVDSTPMYISWRSNQPFPGAGERKSRRRGPTIPDFATHQTWEPGDEISNIDWVASAQTNMEQLVLRLYHEPRDINVVIVADLGPTMSFGTTEVTKRQFVARLSASILVSAEKTHDLVGLIAYPDQGENHFVSPRPAKSVLRDVLQNVIECGLPAQNNSGKTRARPSSATAAQPPARSISNLSDALKRLPRSRSLVFVVSDFLNLSDADKAALKKAARTHYIVGLGVQDIREQQLPSGFGFYTLKDINTGKIQTIWLSDKNRRQYRLNFEKLQQSLVDFFDQAQIHYAAFSTDNSERARREIRELFWIYR